ncbi:MAG: DUF3850 domain-containing protein [Candidatus Komeilibacteria bacterium]
MRTIDKKIWPEMFDKDQKSPVDFRLADFDLEEGDQIRFREWDPKTKEYTGREYIRTVKGVTKHNSPTKYWTVEELEQKGMYIIEFE